MNKRVKFYSNTDLSSGVNLLRAEQVIRAFSSVSNDQSVNDILEYINIIKYFDNNMALDSWGVDVLNKYSSVVREFKPVIGRFMSTINGNSLGKIYEQVERYYKDDFIDALANYKSINRISREQFVSFLENYPSAMIFILYNKKLVSNFGIEITNMLNDNMAYAEIIIRHYYEKKSNSTRRKTNMPSELDNAKLNRVLSNYVNWENANLNYLELIAGLKKAGEHPVDVHIRYKAHLRGIAFWNQIQPNKHTGIKIGADIRFIDQEKVIDEQLEPGSLLRKIAYSKKWISDNLDYPTLLNNFLFLFKYVDKYCCCQFLSKTNELGAIERQIGIHGNDEYRIGIGYRSKNILSTLQMLAYKNELGKYRISIESLFKWFFEKYLYMEFGVKCFRYIAPSSRSKIIEKILLLSSQLDAVIKQYRMFLEDGTVDRGLFEFASDINPIIDSASMIKRKYIYPKSENMKRIIFDFFSDQSLLSYTKKTLDKYNSFAKLLICEKMRIEDFYDSSIKEIKWLADNKIICIDTNDIIQCDMHMIRILHAFYTNECVAYSYCTEKEKCIIEELIQKNDVESEQKLFTRQEQEYLDYMLNVHTFVNGPELRNKYVHGNCSLNPKNHKRDYLELLKIMVLIVIKINEEFCLKYPEELKDPE